MLAAPAALRAKVENARKQVTTGKAETIRHSPRDGLPAASYSPRGAGLVSPRRLLVIPASLISASGDQDHTTWPSALGSLVWQPQRVHRIPLSTLLTMRSAPLIERGVAREKHRLPKNGSDIFLR